MSTSLRLTARVLPVSPDGAVLLLQDQDPAHPGVRRWGTVGGAVDPGETLVEAALRELREETGIIARADELSEPFHRMSYEFGWDGATYRADATFFALPMARDVEVSFDGLEPAEVGNVFEARWWTPAELEADGTAVHPQIPEIMRRALHAVHPEPGSRRRTTARVLPVNAQDEVLLLLVADPAPPYHRHWLTVGGTVAEGESLAGAARRELLAQTGIDAEPYDLVGPFHVGDHVLPWAGEIVLAHASYFALRVDDPTVVLDRLGEIERATIVEARWLPVGELETLPSTHDLLPHIAGMAVAALAGEPYVVLRRTARVLPVNARGEVLLAESCDPAHPEQPFWSSIGGRVEGEESLVEAGVRELHEETGLVVDPDELSEPFHRGEITYPYNGATFVNDSSWFAIALEADADALVNHDHSELILSYGWLTPEALADAGPLPNPDLPDLMAAAVARVRGEDG